MATTITYCEIENRSLKTEGLLAYMSSLRNKFTIYIFLKLIIYSLSSLERILDLQTIDRSQAENSLPQLKNLFVRYEKVLPLLLNFKFPLFTHKDQLSLIHYSHYLEEVIESLEIGLDNQASSIIESLANETSCSSDIVPWREALEKI